MKILFARNEKKGWGMNFRASVSGIWIKQFHVSVRPGKNLHRKSQFRSNIDGVCVASCVWQAIEVDKRLLCSELPMRSCHHCVYCIFNRRLWTMKLVREWKKSPRFRELSYFRGRVVLEKNAKKYSASERLEELYGDEVVRVYLHKSKLV